MAACRFGASSLKLLSLNLVPSGTKLATLQPLYGPKIPSAIQYDGLVLSHRSEKALIGRKCSSGAQSDISLGNGSEESKPSGGTSQLLPNSAEVESLISEICDTDSIAEFDLKLDGFRLYVKRDLPGKIETFPPPVSAPVTDTTVAAPELNWSASSTSLAISRSVPTSDGIQSFLDKASDEGLVMLESPRVGFFRISRTIKGKRAPPSCKEKQTVKEGQVVCFIEQLGGELPIEADTSGEIVKILREDGDPVGYGDALMAILPSFPGIKKLQ